MKLTPWFVNGEKPVRAGVYEVSGEKGVPFTPNLFAHWSPRKGWGAASCSAVAAEGGRNRGADRDRYHDRGSWRGLAEEPSA